MLVWQLFLLTTNKLTADQEILKTCFYHSWKLQDYFTELCGNSAPIRPILQFKQLEIMNNKIKIESNICINSYETIISSSQPIPFQSCLFELEKKGTKNCGKRRHYFWQVISSISKTFLTKKGKNSSLRSLPLFKFWFDINILKNKIYQLT